PAALKAMTGELSRRAAISFPDEDVLVATRLSQPSCYTLLASYANLVPRPGYVPNGEDRAWGRRLAKRFGLEPHFDDRGFTIAVKSRKPTCVPILDASAVKEAVGSARRGRSARSGSAGSAVSADSVTDAGTRRPVTSSRSAFVRGSAGSPTITISIGVRTCRSSAPRRYAKPVG